MGVANQKQPVRPVVTVTNKGRALRRGRDQRRIFGGAEDMLADALAAHGYQQGSFTLKAIAGTNGGPQHQCVRFLAKPNESGNIKVRMQPGSNDTAWDYWLCRSPDVDMLELYYAFTSEKGAKPERQEGANDDLLPAADTDAPASEVGTAEEPAPSPSEACPEKKLASFADDLLIVALAIKPCFSKADSRPTPTDLIETLMDEMKWDEAQAKQGYRCLTARGHLKLGSAGGDGQERVMLGSDDLRKAFRELNLHPEPAPKTKVPAQPPMAVRPRGERPFVVSHDRRQQPRLQAIAETPAPQPPVSGDAAKTLGALEALEEKAEQYDAARATLLQCHSKRGALSARRERALSELQLVDQALAAVDQEMEKSLAIVMDDQHAEASRKVEQIKAIIG